MEKRSRERRRIAGKCNGKAKRGWEVRWKGVALLTIAADLWKFDMEERKEQR